MSKFTPLFLWGILWGALWNYSAYLIEMAMGRPQWIYITKLTTGVVTLYPIVEAFMAKAAEMDGADKAALGKLRVRLFLGYFGAAVAYGIGKIIGMALDPVLRELIAHFPKFKGIGNGREEESIYKRT